jgi:hypothetical protein
VQAVTWTSDRGGSGTATGTTAWSAAIPLLDGPNRITIAARDPVGNLSQAEVLVTYLPPDTTPPTVGITFPTDAQEAVSTEPQVNLSGEADDDRAVTRVDWANHRGGSGTATGGRAWWANGIALQPGVNVLSVTAYDDAGNAQSDSLSVTYTPPFTVTPSAGANGSLSASGPQSVNPGGSVFLTASPAAGYRVDQWLVNGAPVQNGGTTFTLTEVAADATVQVTFAVVTFTVRPGAGAGGTITPAVEQTVSIGGSVAFTATPAAGYAVDQWVVNGAPVQVGGTARTLANVTGNAAVQVTFQRLPLRTTIAREPAQPPSAGHQMRLVFTGLAGATYRVEYADNLATDPIDWQLIGTVTANANGEFELVDPPPLPVRRFYRAVEE